MILPLKSWLNKIAMSYSFLSFEDVLELHKMQIENYGGSSGIRDHNLLESAVMMPQASYDGELLHHDPFEIAAAYAFHIAENQPFLDGNKRTALATALVFLDWHNIEIEDPNEELYFAMIDISNKKLNKTGLSQLLKRLAL